MDREVQMRVTALEHALGNLLEELDAKGTLARRRCFGGWKSSSRAQVACPMNWLPLPGGCAKALVTWDGASPWLRITRHSTTGGYGRA